MMTLSTVMYNTFFYGGSMGVMASVFVWMCVAEGGWVLIQTEWDKIRVRGRWGQWGQTAMSVLQLRQEPHRKENEWGQRVTLQDYGPCGGCSLIHLILQPSGKYPRSFPKFFFIHIPTFPPP